MAEIGEPPAKVLKVDNEDNMPQVKEGPELSESYDALEHEMMGEESGIIEGGADVEPGEGQEEWLSEGILTDDDYNPASQEGNQTESQLDSSQDEENINECIERLDTTAESEANIADNVADVAESEAKDNETNVTENQANVTENKANVTENESNVTENESNVTENESNVTENESNVTESKVNLIESKINLTENETKADSDENMIESEVNETLNETNVKDCDTSAETDNTTKDEALLNDEQNTDKINDLLKNENLNESDDTAESNAMESQTFTQPDDLETVNSNNESNLTESKDTVAQKEENIVQTNGTENKDNKVWIDLNIEEAMKHLDGSKDADANTDSIENLLSKKTAIRVEKKVKVTEKQDSDGNDTDDLLRMLEEDDGKTKKKLTKTVADIRAGARAGNISSDDDDFVYEGAAKKLKAAKSAISRKQPRRARPESLEDGDDEHDLSADESISKMFGSKNKPNILKQKLSAKNVKQTVLKQTPGKKIVNVIEKPQNTRLQTPALKQYHNKRIAHTPKSVLKPTPPKQGSVTNALTGTKKEEVKNAPMPRLGIKTPAPFKPSQAAAGAPPASALRAEPDLNEDEEWDEFDMDEDELAESDIDISSHRQRIMKPETMDEEVPSDVDSHSEDGSLYDELPSSDSENCDDWFQLDIRAEKAGDYLPLLGTKAKEMLLAEKQRVASKLLTLKQSHSALCESGRKQAEQLREATMTLAELDDMLKAS